MSNDTSFRLLSIPKTIEAKYDIDHKLSDKKGEFLYKLTTEQENTFGKLRTFVVFLLLAVPVILIGGLIVALALVAVAWINFDIESIYIVFVFGALIVFSWWRWKAGDIGKSNIKNSQRIKDGKPTPDVHTALALGARQYSRAEEDKVTGVLQQIIAMGEENLSFHDSWWVVDAPLPQAFTVGADLFITKGAIESEWLAPILAHEIGHYDNRDGVMLKALRSFVFPIVERRMTSLARLSRASFTENAEIPKSGYEVAEIFEKEARSALYSMLFGGYGVILYEAYWADYFRERDYLADDYVVRLGLGGQLLAYLEEHKLFSQAVPFSQNWSQSTELRADRVRWVMENLGQS